MSFGEVVESLSWEILKILLEEALSSLGQLCSWPCFE